jgi:hypothetical protein
MAGEGYDIDNLEAPKFVSKGEWDITGTTQIEAYTPLKAAGSLTSGTFGVSGFYNVQNWAEPYDDISGISGCIGVTIRKLFVATNTGQAVVNINTRRRKTAVMHEGYLPMRYQSGTLDGTVITLKYGDVIAPCTSGFRVWEPLNQIAVSVIPLGTGYAYGTGVQQNKLGWYADVQSNATGTRKRVKILTRKIYGERP